MPLQAHWLQATIVGRSLRDAEDGPPAPAPAPGPGPTPPPALPPGYFEHMHDAENYMANQQALSGHDGPQPYLNPWYS